MEYAYRVVNVFTVDGDRLSGNPLCVFEDGGGLGPAAMQALARQFNLSETTFILPSDEATAAVRIFTPTYEMPFAGHPSLGTAHVVRALGRGDDAVTLEMRAGRIPVAASGDDWSLQARPPRHRAADLTRPQLADMLGLAADDVLDGARWVDTGSEQLVIPLRSADAVRRCKPVPELLERLACLDDTGYRAYVFAETDEVDVRARFFFRAATLSEDPATGSACANLGGWLLAASRPPPLTRTIRQGDEVGRPSRLVLRIDAEGRIFVSGRVVELGRGVVLL